LRLSELIGSEVRDGNRRRVGRVCDVRLVQDGREIEAFGRAFRIEGILVGPRAARRMGVTRPDIKRPLLFRLIGQSAERRTRFYAWDRVQAVHEGIIEVRSSSS
jgi:hypothetical protein